MAQIPAVQTNTIEHGVLLELSIPNVTNTGINTFYISNCYSNITYQDRTYTALGGFLTVGEIQNNIQNAVDELSVTLSAIPEGYLEFVVDRQIKGGEIKIYRVFFDTATQTVRNIDGVDQIFLRFKGIINNYAVQEDMDQNSAQPRSSHSITITCSSILSILDNRISGRRTNRNDYQYRYLDRVVTLTASGGTWGARVLNTQVETDKSFNRIETLHNANFDFGKDGGGGGQSSGQSGSGAGGGTSDTSLHPKAPSFNPVELP